MPQLIGLALLGGVIWYGYRAFKREMERVGRETREAERKSEEARQGKELVKGEDGVYRPGNPESKDS
ncbi:MAG: hypothetical protein ACR2O3_13440 [Rhizobiaceae bacterium]